jgi:cardiolipin synthase
MIRAATWHYYGRLLKAGVRVFEFQGTVMHSKNFVADGIYSTVGSINFDVRSMSVNAENGFAFHSPEFGSRMEALFRQDRARSREVTYQEWRKRGLFRRMKEWIALVWQTYY